MSKPTRSPTWATSGVALITDPGAPKQAEGWRADEIPPAEYFNWFKNLVGQWVEYLDGEVDAIKGTKLAYDAIVGVGGTHETLQEAIDAVSNGSRILVASSQVLDTMVVIDGKIDLVIEIKPGKTITTATALAKALQIKNANRVQVIGGRFTGFTDAIEIQTTVKNTVLDRIYFSTISGDEVIDNGINSTINTISEVL